VNHIHGQADGVEHPLDRVEADALRLLELLGLDEVELSLVLCDDARIQALNRDYRGKDAPTDVLSFSMREGEEAEADDPVLGDLVISLDTAARQASELGHTL
jgi:probable rRNA maturation factor